MKKAMLLLVATGAIALQGCTSKDSPLNITVGSSSSFSKDGSSSSIVESSSSSSSSSDDVVGSSSSSSSSDDVVGSSSSSSSSSVVVIPSSSSSSSSVVVIPSSSSSSSSVVASSSSSSSSLSSSSSSVASTNSVVKVLDGPDTESGVGIKSLQDKFIAKLVPKDELDAFYETVMDSGLNKLDADRIMAAVTSTMTAAGIAFANDMAAGQLGLEEDDSFEIKETPVKGALGKGNIFQYEIDQNVTAEVKGAEDADVPVELDITFSFPVKNPLFGIGEGTKEVHLNGMEVVIDKLTASSGDVDFEVLSKGGSILTLSIDAYITEAADKSITDVNLLTEVGLTFLIADLHATVGDGDTAVSVDVTGAINTIEGALYLEKDTEKSSIVSWDADNFEVALRVSGDSSGSVVGDPVVGKQQFDLACTGCHTNNGDGTYGGIGNKLGTDVPALSAYITEKMLECEPDVCLGNIANNTAAYLISL